ncbi:MAG TPA: hypothetical protein P5232_03935 [Candidatus Moranbacteria bacterium]|nr:hypothetical protein [Candidatus Moranbacteria bacterium]
MKSHWHEIFVTESVDKVVEILRGKRIVITYHKDPRYPDAAMGYVDGNYAVIMNCKIYRKKEREEIFERTCQKAQSSIEISSSSCNFLRIIEIIKNNLHVVSDDDYTMCNRCKEEREKANETL